MLQWKLPIFHAIGPANPSISWVNASRRSAGGEMAGGITKPPGSPGPDPNLGSSGRSGKSIDDKIAEARRRKAQSQGPASLSNASKTGPQTSGIDDDMEDWAAPLPPDTPINDLDDDDSRKNRKQAASTPPAVGQTRRGEIRGTVLNVVPPQANVNPWLTFDLRTSNGTTYSVKAWFFLGAITAPQVLEGHVVRVRGRRTRRGHIKATSIINESNGSRWR
jgi:hypothetical protein